LLSWGIGTGEGAVGSARERQNAQRHKMFHWSILVLRLSLSSWSLAVWESLILSIGDSITRARNNYLFDFFEKLTIFYKKYYKEYNIAKLFVS
jgi:recombinational DNA repair ATPase RecF